jgi:hypothetical protein
VPGIDIDHDPLVQTSLYAENFTKLIESFHAQDIAVPARNVKNGLPRKPAMESDWTNRPFAL